MEQTAVLIGSSLAKIDEKGRLKIPSLFREFMEQKLENSSFGRQLFVTSMDGEWVLVYPLATWIDLQPKLAERGVLRRFNYFGQIAELDKQSRVLIHPRLRDRALMTGEVEVIGQNDHLEIWNHERYEATLAKPVTDEDWTAVKPFGIERPD